jgi:O-antigen/teichoic acid export membrane protein
VRTYGLPRGWVPSIAPLYRLASANAPLAGADALEWGSRNVDRFILGVLFAPKVVGVYYMAQQVASLPQKLKTSFDPILAPVVTEALARDDRAAVARQVRQVAFWIIAAQLLLALVGSIPARSVIGVVGPQFVAGAAAMVFLLFAEVLASTGAVSETALVYIARHLNLAVSSVMLVVQVALSFALVAVVRRFGWPLAWQAAAPAVALAASVGLTSVIKAGVLGRLLAASVSPLRRPLFGAAAAAVLVGAGFSLLPPSLAWARLPIGEPAIAATYLFVLWRYAFAAEDRALFAGAARDSDTVGETANGRPGAA